MMVVALSFWTEATVFSNTFLELLGSVVFETFAIAATSLSCVLPCARWFAERSSLLSYQNIIRLKRARYASLVRWGPDDIGAQ